MKKAVKIFLSIFVCLLSVIILSSCSDSRDNTVDTTNETLSTEESYSTSGKINDTVEWRYDESTSTFCFFGTGKVTFGHINKDMRHWVRIAENVRFEEGITDAEDYVFSYLDECKSVYIPASYIGTVPKTERIEKFIAAENNPVYSSDENGVLFNQDKTEIICFPACSPIEVYEISEGVTTIRIGAFDKSVNLKNVVIPNSISGISRGAFQESSVYLNPENWEDGLFYAGDCLVEADWETNVEHIVVREGTRRIEAHAFVYCENIKSITVPDSVEIIGAQAFESCPSLENIYIGSGVKEIGDSPFVYDVEGLPCINLESIEVSDENENYTSVDGVLYNKEMTTLIQYPLGKKQQEYVIPDTVTTIGYGAFCHCDELTKLTVGKGITVIDYCLLFGCDNIETVILPETLTVIDSGAFKYSGIKYIDIPDSVTYLGCEAMTACDRLETVNIGKGVSFIHEVAIRGSSLKEIRVDPENEFFTSENGVLYNKDKTELLLYPANKSGDTYRIPSTVKTIKTAAIMSANNLREIYLGSNVERIEDANFYESVPDPERDFHYETNYVVYFDGTEERWNELFVNEYERENIDKSQIRFLQ